PRRQPRLPLQGLPPAETPIQLQHQPRPWRCPHLDQPRRQEIPQQGCDAAVGHGWDSSPRLRQATALLSAAPGAAQPAPRSSAGHKVVRQPRHRPGTTASVGERARHRVDRRRRSRSRRSNHGAQAPAHRRRRHIGTARRRGSRRIGDRHPVRRGADLRGGGPEPVHARRAAGRQHDERVLRSRRARTVRGGIRPRPACADRSGAARAPGDLVHPNPGRRPGSRSRPSGRHRAGGDDRRRVARTHHPAQRAFVLHGVDRDAPVARAKSPGGHHPTGPGAVRRRAAVGNRPTSSLGG
ncbi:MAG: hypothetical protein JWP54_776, partial [Cryobacterium sp.]|nr:hypothetical protein [Cryobacterium sp.]